MLTKTIRNTASGILLVSFLLAILALSAFGAEPSENNITGTVVDIDTKEPLIGANVAILNKYGGTVTDTVGGFFFKSLAEGIYKLQISHIGYESKVIDSILIDHAGPVNLNVELIKKPVSIKGVTVTPGHFTIMGDEPVAAQILSREVIETRPQLSEDLFRAVQRLPGIAYNDFSAKFNIRGGEQDEVLINLDGLEIYEPFHLKDVDGGVISITDIAAVEGVDLMSGGYPANYGDRMSGVFNITSKNPSSDQNHMSVGLSLMNARFLSEGTFSNKRGSWLISGRRGYLDLMLQLVGQDEELRPSYYDLFGKVRYKLNNRHTLTTNFLRAHDNLRYLGEQTEDENNLGDTLLSSYGNTYFWLTLDSYLSDKVVGKTITSVGQVNHSREGQVLNDFFLLPDMRVKDERKQNIYGLKSDWEFEASKDVLLRAGFDIRHVAGDYDYQGYTYDYQYFDGWADPYQLVGTEANLVSIDPSGNKISTYLSNRVRFAKFLTGEVGVRYDRTTYTDDENISPRANLAIDISDNTSIKLGWGHFYQIQRVDEINVQDGETEFYDSEKAEHYVAGLEHNFETGENLRLNVFYKKYSDLRPAFRNVFGELVTFPELEEDRVQVNFNGKTSKGVELYIKRDLGEKISWWFSYSLSEVDDDIKSLYYFNEDVQVNYNEDFAFPYDQLHTLYLDFNYRFNLNWQFNVAWQFHTGWPYTDVFLSTEPIDDATSYHLEAGKPWNARHDPFKRLDLRLNRKFFTSKGTLTAFVEVINVLGADNIRNYEYTLVSNDGVLSMEKVTEKWFGTMPSFGITYDFHF